MVEQYDEWMKLKGMDGGKGRDTDERVDDVHRID